MDPCTREVLSWKLSETLEGRFCLEAFAQALRAAGTAPVIFNTDQRIQVYQQGIDRSAGEC